MPHRQRAAWAVRLYRKAADAGIAWAQYALAESYRKGEGTAKNPAKAVELYRLAAANGNAWAQFQLAESYRKGEGVGRDPAKAVELYRSAAATGNPLAQYGLAESYRKGEGIAKDPIKATELYRLAAEQGIAWAQYHLAESYRKGEGVAAFNAVDVFVGHMSEVAKHFAKDKSPEVRDARREGLRRAVARMSPEMRSDLIWAVQSETRFAMTARE